MDEKRFIPKYDRSQDSNPQYRCKDCSINKMKIVENKK